MSADLPTAEHFSDPVQAQREWQIASQQFVFSWENSAIPTMLEHCTNYVALMVARDTPTDPRPECRTAADAVIAYFADITAARQQRGPTPRPPIDAALVDPSPRDAAGYTRALNAYTQWWLANH
jgi:hypothetical protein